MSACSARKPDMLADWVPLLRDLRHYRKEWLSHDAIAGLSVAAVQIPTAIAYANLAGFPPEVGLYASMLPVLVYALFESPAGTLPLPPFPASAAGPDLRQSVLGSEGRFGVLTEAVVRVR